MRPCATSPKGAAPTPGETGASRPMTAPLNAYRVTVIEWLTHVATIKAASPENAQARTRQLWADLAEHEMFEFHDSGIDGVVVEEDAP